MPRYTGGRHQKAVHSSGRLEQRGRGKAYITPCDERVIAVKLYQIPFTMDLIFTLVLQ